jgi:phage/plasmid-associated DNA primase
LANGLVRPAVVTEATAEYFDEQDLFAQWLGDCCAQHPTFNEKPAALYQSWRGYCDAHGVRPGTDSAFGENMKRAGFEKRRPARVNGKRPAPLWHGLMLTAEARADAADDPTAHWPKDGNGQSKGQWERSI